MALKEARVKHTMGRVFITMSIIALLIPVWPFVNDIIKYGYGSLGFGKNFIFYGNVVFTSALIWLSHSLGQDYNDDHYRLGVGSKIGLFFGTIIMYILTIGISTLAYSAYTEYHQEWWAMVVVWGVPLVLAAIFAKMYTYFDWDFIG